MYDYYYYYYYYYYYSMSIHLKINHRHARLSRSLKVTGTNMWQSATYDFHLTFHSNQTYVVPLSTCST